ncbi:MAG: histidine kinase [Desulfuromonadaceae bacterium]|nr:histidine kinase [Desulfuromonadaceae bacterium]
MNFKKTVAIATAAGALAAISVPAFAFENEFHGMYRLRAIMSNFENADATLGGVLAKDAKTMMEFEQRARIQYIAKASDDLKLVTHFEMDSTWGDNSGGNGGRGIGGAAGADSVNLETKNVYLDFNCPLTGANVKLGIQGFTDAYKGIYFNDDLGGVFLSKNLGGVKATAGFARLFDGTTWTAAGALNASNVTSGRKTADLYVLDAKYNLNKDMTVGGSYYLYRNDMTYKTQDVHTIGVNAAAKMGTVAVDGFVLLQAGEDSARRDLLAFAAQVAAKAAVGPGSLSASILYASGDDGKDAKKSSAFQTTPNGGPGSSSTFYSSNMALLMRTIYAMDTDKALVTSTNNGDQGLLLGTVGFGADIKKDLSASANIGVGMDAQRNTTTSSSSKYMGTELNASLNYKLFSNLTSTFQAAYVVLGDRYKGVGTGVAANKTPDNPYLTEIMFNYTF